MSSADAKYEPENDAAADNSYASRTGQSQIPVQKDQAPIEDPIDPATADSDEMLARDDADAIDKGNILGGGRTRGAKPEGTYREPGDEEGLPQNDGTSSTA